MSNPTITSRIAVTGLLALGSGSGIDAFHCLCGLAGDHDRDEIPGWHVASQPAALTVAVLLVGVAALESLGRRRGRGAVGFVARLVVAAVLAWGVAAIIARTVAAVGDRSVAGLVDSSAAGLGGRSAAAFVDRSITAAVSCALVLGAGRLVSSSAATGPIVCARATAAASRAVDLATSASVVVGDGRWPVTTRLGRLILTASAAAGSHGAKDK